MTDNSEDCKDAEVTSFEQIVDTLERVESRTRRISTRTYQALMRIDDTKNSAEGAEDEVTTESLLSKMSNLLRAIERNVASTESSLNDIEKHI